MEEIISMALFVTTLVNLAAKFIEIGLIEPAAAPLNQLIGSGFNKKKAEQELRNAFIRAIEKTTLETEEKDILAYYRKIKMDRLEAKNNEALRRTVALALVGFTDPNADPPQDLMTAIGWSPARADQLSVFLANLRSALADTCLKPLIDYADQAEQNGLLREMLLDLTELSNTIISTPEGEALRVVIVQQWRLSEAEAREIEKEYRGLVADSFRKHRIQGLVQVEKVIHLNLKDIYQDLNLRLLKSQKAQEVEKDADLQAGNAERLERNLRDVNQQISSALEENPRLVIVGKPGSGKTTSLKYISLMLALGDAGAARLQLSAPFIPIYLRLGEYAQELKKRPTLSLEAFIIQYLTDKYPGVTDSGKFLKAALQKGTCYLLLDGLDEVGDIGEKLFTGQTLHQKVLKEVQNFADQRCGERCSNRIIVSSRLEGYHPSDLSDFSEMELCLLHLPDEVKAFLLRWYTAYFREYDDQLSLIVAESQAQKSMEKIMGSIMRSDSIKLLAANPLLLTILVVISENLNTPLPNRRAELFKIVAETMVKNWRRSQTDLENRIYHHNLTSNDIYYIMASLAYWIHENKPGGTMPIDDWKDKITALLEDYADKKTITELVDEFIHHATEETGLLTERSPGEIGFFHLTLEEYLAAVEIARKDGTQQLACVKKHWQDPYWQEILLLTAGELEQRGNRDLLASYLTNFLNFEPENSAQTGCNVFLAGRALADIGGHSVPPNPQRMIKRALKFVSQDLSFDTECPNEPQKVSPILRADCADTLDELGYIPEDLYTFVAITGNAISSPFLIGKYPVTNAQYARFLKPENFTDQALWMDFPKFASPDKNYQELDSTGEDGWAWLQDTIQKENRPFEDGVMYPRFWRDSRFGCLRACAPVVGVTWWEANAYARWLRAHWDGLEEGQQGHPRPALIRLPREDEWALAAGGEADGRYAFGALENPEKEIARYCNTSKSGIRRTTPVWMYPQGVSPNVVMDMSGNVWEWQGNHYDKNHDTWSLRGGSWGRDFGYAHVAIRFGDFYYNDWYYDIGFRLVALPS